MRCQNPFAFRPGPVSFWTTVVYLAIAIPLIYIHETVPSAPADHSLYRGLNLTEAWQDLEVITSAFHPYNSHQNDRVREFIIARARAILERNEVPYTTETLGGVAWRQEFNSPPRAANDASGLSSKPRGATLFDDRTSNVTWTVNTTRRPAANVGTASWTAQYFEGNNFYVYIHGKEDNEGDWWKSESGYKKSRGKGGVLVNCHFDSVSTGYGATDDGMACVSMLQMLSYFTSEDRQPKHGIVLLFNNAEEDGLLGARAFAYSPLQQFCHTFVNLEGAGAGGRAVLFRTTDLEVTRAYSNSPYPFGTVVGANAFEKGVIKSGTDYEIFADYFGQRGMDIAFYSPRSRYHTEDDDTRHTSVNSIWHMLSAGLASTEELSKTTGKKFSGGRSDGNKDLVQNGKRTSGVWFDMFGSAWVAFALRGLFAWSLTLLVATPLILFVVTYILARHDKYYFFARDIKIHSEVNDDPVTLGGWKGLFRFPLALIFAAGLTIASVLLLAKFNPFIGYSSSYAVWAMTVSLYYFAFWLIMRGASFVRPSALHRGFANMWLFIFGWAVQVAAAVLEDRAHLAAMYSTVFLQSAVFLSLLISLLELSALPGKHDFAHQQHDAHQARDSGRTDESVRSTAPADNDDEEDGPAATETTPLRVGEQGYGGNSQPTFANTYRRSVSADPAASAAAAAARKYQPYDREQSWSGRLPTFTWIIQLFIMAPITIIVFGSLGLLATSSLSNTGTDGSNIMLPFLSIALLSIVLVLPIAPFIHRVTHHIPIFLLFVFIGTFIYNLVAFPFSTTHRFKFNFQQIIDLDTGSNEVVISGIREYSLGIIKSLPSVAGQEIRNCNKTFGRDLMDCSYDASSLPPNVVDGKELDELLTVSTSDISDGKVHMVVDALDTRTCNLVASRPIHGFSIEGGMARDNRFGPFPAEGLTTIRVWRREWEGAWNVTMELGTDGQSATPNDQETEETPALLDNGELKSRKEEPFSVQVSCGWSDSNNPSTIPALHELQQYMPTWAVVTKRTVGLVEVRKTYYFGG